MKTRIHFYLPFLTIAALFAFPIAAYAASPSPFIGEWQATGVDGGDIRLTIAGRPSGPFQITWTESYFGFCGREAGIVRGTGRLNEGNPNVLEADLHLTCFTTGASLDFHVAWRYDPPTDTIAYPYPDPVIMTWHRPGRPLPFGRFQIIAHSDEDWVEGMGFEAETVVSLRIFDPGGALLYGDTVVASYPEWEPAVVHAIFDVGYDLKAGDHLWMTDGKTAKDLIVTTLEITEVNLLEHTVSGTAEPGSQVIIEYFPEMFSVTADPAGNWTASVEGLTAGLAGLASQEDEDGNLTRVVFYIPRLDLRVNYGHDWVESFYEAGHTVLITVTDNEGNVKATAELVTEPKDFWGGETGFATQPEDWRPSPPDIQPYDWVYGWVDNGASAQVQIGDINGMIDLEADFIEGTITAPWFSEAVNVECHPWGAPVPTEMKFDTVQPDGVAPYSCSWAGEWDIQPYQDVGVGYYGADGHWVANAFFLRNPRIIASVAGDWFWTTDFKPGTLNLFIYTSAEEGAGLLWQGSREADEAGFVFVGYEDHGLDLVPGNYLVVSDGGNEKGLVLETITMEVFDTANEIMAGTAPAGRTVWTNAGEQTFHQTIEVTVDANGAWLADFKSIGFDITEAMRPGSFAHIYDEDGDANEAGTPPPPPVPNPGIVASVAGDWFWTTEFNPGTLNLFIYESAAEGAGLLWQGSREADEVGFAFVGYEDHGQDLVPGNYLVVSDGVTQKGLVLETITMEVFDTANEIMAGTAPGGREVVVVAGMAEAETQGGIRVIADPESGAWMADFKTIAFDITEAMRPWSFAQIHDEDGDANEAGTPLPPPSPWLRAHPVWESVDGWYWPLGATLHLTIDDPETPESPDLEMSKIVEVVSDPPDNNSVWFEFAGVYDLKPGDEVTLTDGTTTRHLVVSVLTIDAVDVEADTAAGTAEVGAVVRLPTPSEALFVTADASRAWYVDFHEVGFDLMPGTMVIAEVYDADGDLTSFEWDIPAILSSADREGG